MGQRSDAVPPPFTSSAGGSNSPISEAEGIDVDHSPTESLEEERSEDSFWATVVVVNCSEDIIEKLIPYAAESELFILGATGEVSYAELVNPKEAPVANTVLQGSFEISAIEGKIGWTNNHDKSKNSDVSVLLAGADGRILGGPVRSLIAKSSIKVFVSTTSKDDVNEIASEENEFWLLEFQDQAKRMADVVDHVYKDTLNQLNQTNTK